MARRIGKTLFMFALLAAGGWIVLNFRMGQEEMGEIVAEAVVVVGLGFILSQILAGP